MKNNVIKYFKELFWLEEISLKKRLEDIQKSIKEREALDHTGSLSAIFWIVCFGLIILSLLLKLTFLLPFFAFASIINLIIQITNRNTLKKETPLWALKQRETNVKNYLLLLNKLNNLEEFLKEFEKDEEGLDKAKINDLINILKRLISNQLLLKTWESLNEGNNLEILKSILSNSDYLTISNFLTKLETYKTDKKSDLSKVKFDIDYSKLNSLLSTENSYKSIPDELFPAQTLKKYSKTYDKNGFLRHKKEILRSFNIKEADLINSCYNWISNTFYIQNLLLYKLNNEYLNYKEIPIEIENFDFLILDEETPQNSNLIDNIFNEDILSDKEKEFIKKKLNIKTEKSKQSLKETLYI